MTNQEDNYEFHLERTENDRGELANELEPSADDLHIKAGLQFAGWDADGDMEWIGTDKEWNKFEELDNELPNEIINLQIERD